ncbi:MAG: DUF362 domain-containing protein [Candidatus Alcyoniella australis]|nr:DUF362 domain-containing protein [Candidatus Alcyoniella australis]
MTALVGAARCQQYDRDLISQAFALALERAGGWPAAIGPGRKVLVKPNLLLPVAPEKAVTTHPEVLRAVLKNLLELGADVCVGEEPGMLPIDQVRRAFTATGTAAVCDELGVEYFTFQDHGYCELTVPEGQQTQTLFVAQDIVDADAVISLAKAKTHMQAMFTGAVKNMFGTIPARERKRLHTLAQYEAFNESLVDILAVARPTFSVMDAVVGMSGRGPSEGTIEQIGWLLCGSDPVAVDRATAELMGFSKVRIHYLDHATARGLGESRIEHIELRGMNLASDALKLAPPPTWFRNMPRLFYRMFYGMLWIRPVINVDRCQRCETCANACPAECITFDPLPRIDPERCIECFCCHELCPHGAVDERMGLARRLAMKFGLG